MKHWSYVYLFSFQITFEMSLSDEAKEAFIQEFLALSRRLDRVVESLDLLVTQGSGAFSPASMARAVLEALDQEGWVGAIPEWAATSMSTALTSLLIGLGVTVVLRMSVREVRLASDSPTILLLKFINWCFRIQF